MVVKSVTQTQSGDAVYIEAKMVPSFLPRNKKFKGKILMGGINETVFITPISDKEVEVKNIYFNGTKIWPIVKQAEINKASEN